MVLLAGGYSPSPLTFRAGERVPAFPRELLALGYAYAETGYSEGGFAIAEGVKDLRALRAYFSETYGRPERTFVIGESKGGLVAVLLMEAARDEFDGALVISALLSSPYELMRRAFDLLAVYEREFPGVLPSPSGVPAAYVPDEQTLRKILSSLDANPNAASALRDRASVRRNEDLAGLLAFHTDALRDLQTRCGGNPFDNEARDVAAAATPRPHVPANSKAAECARSLPTPTGLLRRPVLAVDTEYDPVIPGSAEEYDGVLQSTGHEQMFVRQVVPDEGHLNIRTADRLRAFSALVKWSVEGVRPSPVK